MVYDLHCPLDNFHCSTTFRKPALRPSSRTGKHLPWWNPYKELFPVIYHRQSVRISTRFSTKALHFWPGINPFKYKIIKLLVSFIQLSNGAYEGTTLSRFYFRICHFLLLTIHLKNDAVSNPDYAVRREAVQDGRN
jgi:hypothetical protein